MADITFRSAFTKSAMKAAETGTGPPAQALVTQCGLLPNPPALARILDNACGAGVVTARLLSNLPFPPRDLEIVCGDLDQTMIDLTSSRIQENGWRNVKAERFDAVSFTHVLMNFGPQLMPDPIAVLEETYRLLSPHGTTGFTSWTSPGFIPSVREVIPSFNGPPSIHGPWTREADIISTLTNIGFVDIKLKEMAFETDEGDMEAYLELMKLLLPKLLVGTEEGEEYERLMRGRGETRMEWKSLMVTARKG